MFFIFVILANANFGSTEILPINKTLTNFEQTDPELIKGNYTR